MLLNHEYRFLFVHVPKTAGTSIREYLSQVPGSLGHKDVGLLYQHCNADQIEAALGRFDGYLRFGVYRDPIDRTRSSFAYVKAWFGTHSGEGDRWFIETDDINEFIASEVFWSDGPDGGYLPQAFWLSGVDRVLRFDHLDEDMAELVDDLGLFVVGSVPHLNATPRDKVGALTPESIAAIKERYQEDFIFWESRSTIGADAVA